jgi:predicted O-methyltransferase YrrM
MDDTPAFRPPVLDAILADAAAADFRMSCEERTGALLAALAAAKPGGGMLELGTGAGVGTAWLLHGMSPDARLLSVDADPRVQAIATARLGGDPRVRFVSADVDAWLDSYCGPRFALAYVDCPPGKFFRLDDVLRLLEPGGLYIVDDLRPQATWPPGHQASVDALLSLTARLPGLLTVPLAWASGLLVGVRTSSAPNEAPSRPG